MSTSEAIASTSAPQICSAASSVQPPANTARRANRSCSAGVSRSWLQAIVARSVRCRSGAEREPPASRRQPLLEPFEQDRRRERLHARSRQLDRERQAVEPPADLDDLAVRGEVGADGGGTLHEEIDRFPLPQRVDGDLPLAVDVQRLAARDEHRQMRTGADRLGDAGGRVEQMLEVVQHEQQPLVAHRCRQRVLRAERLSGGGLDECGIGERGERHPPDPAVVVVRGRGGGLQREPRLAAPTRAGQRHQPDVGSPQQCGDLVDLPLAAEERRRRNRQVRLVQRLQRREVVRPELEEPLDRGSRVRVRRMPESCTWFRLRVRAWRVS